MKKTTTILLVSLLGMATIGVLGFATKGFRDFKLKKTAYEKQVEKYDVKDAIIKMDELKFYKETNVISSTCFVYVHDSVDVSAIEIPNTYGESFDPSYDMAVIQKANGAYLYSSTESIFHIDEYVVFRFSGPSNSFKLKASDGTYHDLSAIAYATNRLVEPIKKSSTYKTAYVARLENDNAKDALITDNKLTFDKETSVINANCFVYVHDSVDISAIEMPSTYAGAFAESYDMTAIRKANGDYLVPDNNNFAIYHFENYAVFRFFGPGTSFKLKKADGTYHDLTAIAFATENVIKPDSIVQ